MCFADATNNPNEPILDFSILVTALDELIEMGVTSFLISGGEPTMYPHFKDLISYFHRHSIVPGIATNGTLLTNELCQFLSFEGMTHNVYVSLDSYRADVHDSIRGRECFHLICNNIQNLVKNNIKFAISFVAMNANSDSIDEMYRLADSLGASFLNLIRFNLEGRGQLNKTELSLKKGLTFEELIEQYAKNYNGVYCFGGENCILPIRLKVNKKMLPDDSDLSKYLIIRSNGNVHIGRASSNVVIGNIYECKIGELISGL